MENKRGAGLSTTTIILLILGLVILVMLIMGFMMGWSKLMPFLSSENVDTIVNACNTACVTQSIYGYCTQARKLVSEKETVDATCNELATEGKYTIYGIKKCPSITCPQTQVVNTTP